MSSESRYVRKVASHAAESRRDRKARIMVEPLLDKLKPGHNQFSPEEFRALAVYFLADDRGRFERAISDDKFAILGVIIGCERKLTYRNGVTVSEFARTHGVNQSTLWYRVDKSGFAFLKIGAKKLYYPEDLASLLSMGCGNNRELRAVSEGDLPLEASGQQALKTRGAK